MKRLVATVVVTLAIAGSAFASSTTVTTMPDLYREVQLELTAGCGADRAQTIANLAWDVDIHKGWMADVQRHPENARFAGDVDWHRYWISVYQHAITLLVRDCPPR